MANGRVDVYFYAGNAEQATSEQTETGANESEAITPKANQKSAARSAITSMAIDYGKRTIQYGVSVFGDLTGDYRMQTQVSGAVEMGSTLLMMAQFPVGTVAAAFKIATGIASTTIQTNNANKETALLRERMGNERINNSEVNS